MGVEVFQGASQVNLDAKGRMAVPTRIRDPLTQGGTVKLVLTAHPEGCLLLYPAPGWEPVRAQVMAFPSLNRELSLWKRLLVGFAEETELDGAGRLLVSPELRDFAHITRPVMLVGQGSHYEIWDLDSWKQQLERLKTGGSATAPPGMENFSL
jgi:MraZ protein